MNFIEKNGTGKDRELIFLEMTIFYSYSEDFYYHETGIDVDTEFYIEEVVNTEGDKIEYNEEQLLDLIADHHER